MSEKKVYICDGLRTPFGKYGGSLSHVRTDDLAAIPIKKLMERHPEIDPSLIDEVILGCANQSGEDNRNVARMALLLAGLPETVPGITVNRLCASGLEAIADGARKIRLGESDLIIAGGVENMTRSPFVMGKSEMAFGRTQKLEDTTMGWRFINPLMKEKYGVDTMPQTGENVAKEFNISRADQDAFALRSQERTARAQEKGIFNEEICSVELPKVKGQAEPQFFSVDEHPRATSIPALAKLKGVVTPDGTVTAGNASGVNDGAVALLLASEEAVKKYKLKPIARILGSAAKGVQPRIMGMGPVPAVNKLLSQHKLKISDIDVIELNEAFASQSIAVLRELKLPEDGEFINANGGAIALGHPLGASGARIVLHAALELRRRGGRYAIATMCVGVGQGSAMLIERV